MLIALALACEPKLLIADEPTTALDVMVQAQVLELLAELQRDNGLALLFITHDLSVLTTTCERLAVMYAGRIVEDGPSHEVFGEPLHPYSAALARAFPTIGDPSSRMNPRWPRRRSAQSGRPAVGVPVPSRAATGRSRSAPRSTSDWSPPSRARHAACVHVERPWVACDATVIASLLELDDVKVTFASTTAAACAPSTACRSTSSRARCWRSSASRAAARRR